MICLCLTAATLAENQRFIERYASHCRLYELRVDRLLATEYRAIAAFVQQVTNQFGLRGILTIRLPVDGGSWTASEPDRQSLFLDLLAAGGNQAWAYVDLEASISHDRVASLAKRLGVGLIRSAHDFTGLPANSADLVTHIEKLTQFDPLETQPGVVRKFAGLCRGVADLAVLLAVAAKLRTRQIPFVLIGMGEFGQISRVIGPKIGSLWTYASPRSEETDSSPAAPGHLDPQTLDEIYGYYQISPRTAVFGVIGQPIAHSLSPEFHNPRLRAAGGDAVYLRCLVDDMAAFRSCADLLDAQGFSVTVPHKVAALNWATKPDSSAALIGAANTLVKTGLDWTAYNTDADGFFQPLAQAMAEAKQSPSDGAALVIGAGGAAKAVVFSLAQAGFSILIANRTLSTARDLAEVFGRNSSQTIEACSLGEAPECWISFSRGRPGPQVIVNTTTIGMDHGPGAGFDPVPNLQFGGDEWVYDLIYAPELTPILARAQQSGCRTLNGSGMFVAQAEAQSRLFLTRLVSQAN